MTARTKNWIFWGSVLLFMITLFNIFSVPPRPGERELNFTQFMTSLEKGDIEKVNRSRTIISTGYSKSGQRKFRTYVATATPDLLKVLREKNVIIEEKPPDEAPPWYFTFFITYGPFVLILVFWFFLMRQMQVGGNKALSFGKSRARLLTEDRKKITFADVAWD